MKFSDAFKSREHMFSIGVEETTGRFYVSIPVSNGMVDYEEYYEIDRASFDLFQKDPCRRRELDNLLIVQTGANRGTAV
ncbi:hypothetical protein [Pseudomonas sp. KK4]|uniref:hypothetical protein n=1 Tax=Pseudomonas sp. KK4 TaxID=1855729 RepID=UPI00097CB6E1|nr:hypothetical protein [Pseudomonas sp. KK4]